MKTGNLITRKHWFAKVQRQINNEQRKPAIRKVMHKAYFSEIQKLYNGWELIHKENF